MCLNIRFIANVHAIEIREFVKGTVRRIMAGANGVEIVLSVKYVTRGRQGERWSELCSELELAHVQPPLLVPIMQ
jgi:hypothetical protein